MTNENKTDEQILRHKLKARLLYENNIPAHVTTNSDYWLNGYITYFDSEKKYIKLLDRKLGEKMVFYEEIKVIIDFDGDYSTLPTMEGK